MNETISKFSDENGFEITLTDEKIYVTSIGSQETFALRSVSGIGTYDDLEKFNEELNSAKQKAPKLRLIGAGVVLTVIGAVAGPEWIAVIIGLILIVLGVFSSNPEDKIKLDSYFRIMLSGGDRKFKFNKQSSNASDIANFINKVEDTLTAYNK